MHEDAKGYVNEARDALDKAHSMMIERVRQIGVPWGVEKTE